MNTTRQNISLAVFGSLVLLLPSASKSADTNTSKREDGPKPQGLQIDMVYENGRPSGQVMGGGWTYGSSIYIFGKQGVSVYKIIGPDGNIWRLKKNGSLSAGRGGRPKGSKIEDTNFSDASEAVLGPGDRVPVLENAPYKVLGSSIYVDWSENHSLYFPLTDCSSGSEVFTVKNDGLVLESATTPGFTLTLNFKMSAGEKGDQQEVTKTVRSSDASPRASAPLDQSKSQVGPSLDSFESLDAWQVGIETNRLISPNGVSPVFSPGCDKVAYVAQDEHSILIKSIPDLQTEKVFRSIGGGSRLAWSPNGKRLVSVEESGSVTIVEIESGKVVELPNVRFNTSWIYWLKDDEISSIQQTLNLNTLNLAWDDSAPARIAAALAFSSHPLIRLSYFDDRVKTDFFVVSKTRDYRKFLVLIDNTAGILKRNAEYKWSRNARYVTEELGAFSAGQTMHELSLLTLGKTKLSRVEIALQDFRGAGNPKETLTTSVRRGNPVTAELFAPLRNPLNDQVVGPTEKRKAFGDIREKNGLLLFCTTTEMSPPEDGDVAVKFMAWTPNRGAGGEVPGNIWAQIGAGRITSTGAPAQTLQESPSQAALPPKEPSAAGSTMKSSDAPLESQPKRGGVADPPAPVKIGSKIQQNPAWPVIKNAIVAHGGIESIWRAHATRSKLAGRTSLPGFGLVSSTFTFYFQHSGQLRQEAVYQLPKGPLSQTLTYSEGIVRGFQNGKSFAVSAPAKRELKREVFMQDVENLRALLDDRYQVRLNENVTVNGKLFPNVSVSSGDNDTVTLLFDADTHLLARRRFEKSEKGGKTTLCDLIYSNYTTNAWGLKVAKHVEAYEGTDLKQQGDLLENTVLADIPNVYFTDASLTVPDIPPAH